MDNSDKLIKELQSTIASLKDELKESKRAQLALDAAGFDIWENNFVTGKATNSNQKLFETLGYNQDELPDNVSDIMDLVHPDDMKKIEGLMKDHFDGKADAYRAELRMKNKKGSWVWIGSYGQVKERNIQGGVTKFIGVTFNIDQRRITEETLKIMAYNDVLTNLGNRRMLFESGALELERSLRYNHPCSLLITDIDGFKQINDTHGHMIGDQILSDYAKTLRSSFRQMDMKIRYGGDEFIVIMPETTLEEAYESALRFNATIERQPMGIDKGITTSIGVAQMNMNDSLESLIRRADKALYRAKEQGRNQVIMDQKKAVKRT